MTRELLAGVAFGVLAVALGGCPATTGGTTSTGGNSGSGSSGSSGVTSSGTGTSGSATSGTGTSGSATTSTGTSGTSGSGSGTGTSSSGTSGGLDAGGPCGRGLAWIGDVCAAPDCSQAPVGAACFLGDGGPGSCIGLSCAALDTSQDPANCGAYGIVCPKGLFCSGGICITAGSGEVDCTVHNCSGRLCVDKVGCLPAACDATVQAEACVLDGGGTGGTTNTPFGICCGMACDDIGNDVNNCGNCGIKCAPGELCVARGCVLAETCGPTNNGRSCALPSGAAGTCCLGACVDLNSDITSCGGCAQNCLVDAGCVGGFCIGGDPICPDGTSDNGIGYCAPVSCLPNSYGTPCFPDGGSFSDKCCSAGCTDISSDPQNCGGCGRSCAPGALCTGGTCLPLSDCTVSSGTTCALDGGGGATGSCCEGLCSDPSSDDLNCGVCGIPCPNGSHCTGYQCTTTGGGTAVCDTGGCPGTTECTFERCLPTDCGALPGNSTCALDAGLASAAGSCCGSACVDISSDPSSCGGCGLGCPSGSSCLFYQCQASTGSGDCPAGTACTGTESPCLGTCLSLECSGLPGGASCLFAPTGGVSPDQVCCGASCVDLAQDPANCGTCGTICPSGVCNQYRCFDPDPPAGCLATCAQYTRCVQGQCIDSTCTSEEKSQPCLAVDGTVGVCCGTPACAHLLDDPQNCGACGITCPTGQACANGTCSGSPGCGPGHIGQLCDLDAGTFLCCPGAGCIDTSKDALNCGQCGNACPPGTPCQNSSCF